MVQKDVGAASQCSDRDQMPLLPPERLPTSPTLHPYSPDLLLLLHTPVSGCGRREGKPSPWHKKDVKLDVVCWVWRHLHPRLSHQIPQRPTEGSTSETTVCKECWWQEDLAHFLAPRA